MKSLLKLDCAYEYGQTRITDLYCEAPFKIMSPFYDGRHTEVIQMCASAGLLSGDSFDLEINVGEGSDLTYTSQSYEKIFQSTGETTQKNTRINLAPHSVLYYMPEPVIPFAGSAFQAVNEIHIDSTSAFFYTDIFNCGRVAMGERFMMKYFNSRTVVYVDEVPVFADHTLIDPAHMDYDTIGMWGGHTHNGLMYIYMPSEVPEIELPSGIMAGASRCRRGYVIRALADRGEELEEFFDEIISCVYKDQEGMQV